MINCDGCQRLINSYCLVLVLGGDDLKLCDDCYRVYLAKQGLTWEIDLIMEYTEDEGHQDD